MIQVRPETGVVHLRVQAPMSLTHLLGTADLSPLEVRPDAALIEEWFYYGSVYVDGRRARQDVQMSPGQIVRLHTRRKSYLLVPLKERIVKETEDWLALDKPSGVPTHATLDNFVENAQFQLARELGYPVFVTHRLDIATAGLLLYAKTPAAQALINKSFARGRVEKIYHAIAEAPVPLGLQTHYMDPSPGSPRKVRAEPHEDWWTCQLEVESCEPFGRGHFARVRLLTGKTHQIRAQFAALGAPIWGDVDYGATSRLPYGIALACHRLRLPFRLEEISLERPFDLRTELGET